MTSLVTPTRAVEEPPEPAQEPSQLPSVPGPARLSSVLTSVATFVVLAAVSAFVAMVFWPGYMNLDTVGTLKDARTGSYSDWHSGVWSALWRVLILVGLRGPGWMMAVHVFVLLAGVYLILRARMPRALAVPAAVLVLVFPPVLAWDVEIGTDAWFASSILCGFGFALRCVRTQGAARTVSAVLAVVCAFLAEAARPTAAPAILALLLAVGLIGLPAPRGGWWRLLAAAGAALTATVLIFGSVLGVQYGVLRTSQTHPEQGTYDYDLVVMSVLEGQVLLPPDVYPRQDVAYLEKYSRPAGVFDTSQLLFGEHSAIAIPVQGKKLASLQRAWWDAIRGRPSVYLSERLDSALQQLTITRPPSTVYYGAPPPEYGSDLGFPALHGPAMAYLGMGSANGTTGGPLHRVWAYVLVLVAVAALGIGSRRRADAMLALLSVGLLAYTAAVLVLSPGVTYRYMYPAVAAGTVLLLTLVARAGSWSWARLSPRLRATQS